MDLVIICLLLLFFTYVVLRIFTLFIGYLVGSVTVKSTLAGYFDIFRGYVRPVLPFVAITLAKATRAYTSFVVYRLPPHPWLSHSVLLVNKCYRRLLGVLLNISSLLMMKGTSVTIIRWLVFERLIPLFREEFLTINFKSILWHWVLKIADYVYYLYLLFSVKKNIFLINIVFFRLHVLSKLRRLYKYLKSVLRKPRVLFLKFRKYFYRIYKFLSYFATFYKLGLFDKFPSLLLEGYAPLVVPFLAFLNNFRL